MKRTDKYRDSYKYDNQYQNHKRRAEEDEYRNRAQSQNRPNAQRPNQHRDNRGFEDEPERYYNGRDYRREQQLEEENENQVELKWLIALVVILLIVVAIFVTRAIMNHNDDKVNNDPNVSQNYKNKLKVRMMTSTNKWTLLKVILK